MPRQALSCFSKRSRGRALLHKLANPRPLALPAQVVFVAAFTGLTVQEFSQPGSEVAQRYTQDLRAATSLTTGIPEGELRPRHAASQRVACFAISRSLSHPCLPCSASLPMRREGAPRLV